MLALFYYGNSCKFHFKNLKVKNIAHHCNKLDPRSVHANTLILRIAMLKLWSFTEDFTLSLLNIFSCTYPSSKKNEISMAALELEK